jgi:hypothetical protein
MTTYQNGVKIMVQDVNPLVEIHSTRKRVNNPLVIGMMIVPRPALALGVAATVLRMVEDTQMMLRMMMVGLELVGEVGTRSRLVEVGVEEEEVVVVVGSGTMITSSLPQRRRLMVIQTGNTSSRLLLWQNRRSEGMDRR